MKSAKLILVTVLGSHSFAAGQHYYSGGKAIPLTIDSTKVQIKFAPGLSLNDRQQLLDSITRIAADTSVN